MAEINRILAKKSHYFEEFSYGKVTISRKI